MTRDTDFMKHRRICGLALSPGGERGALLAQQPKKDGTGYATTLWWEVAGRWKQLESADWGSLAWLNENTLLVACAEAEGTGLYTFAAGTGAKALYATLPYAARLEGVLPGGAVLSAVRPATEEKAAEDGNWTVLEEFPFWRDGEGFTSGMRRQLFLCPKGGAARRLSPENADVCAADVSGNQVLYAAALPGVLRQGGQAVYLYVAAKDETRPLLPAGTWQVQQVCLWGKGALFAGRPAAEGPAHNCRFMQMDLAGGAPRLLAAPNLGLGNTVQSDCAFPGRALAADGDRVVFIATVGEASQLYTLDAGGKVAPLTGGKGAVDAVAAAGGRVLCSALRDMRCHEIYQLQPNGKETRLTRLNGGSGLAPERVTFTGAAGKPLQGWALRPAKGAAAQSLPVVLWLPDGPKTCAGPVYHHAAQALAARGYVVLWANVPGSDGHGTAFADIGGAWGVAGYEDVLCFVNAALAACPEADPTRLGVVGTGYGGYLAAWAAGHTDVFKAVVCESAVTNCVSMQATSDDALGFARHQMRMDAYHDAAGLWQRSPLKHVADMRAPTLILHGQEDRRCHISQGQMLFTALKVHGVTARACVFPGEGHSLWRIGRPAARLRRLREIARWLDRYLAT